MHSVWNRLNIENISKTGNQNFDPFLCVCFLNTSKMFISSTYVLKHILILDL